MNHYVFCHGFGFDKNYWNSFLPIFRKEKCTYLDLGYFRDQNYFIENGTSSRLIGISHSLGLIKLLSMKKHFDYFIGLNGFVSFLGFDSCLQQKREKELSTLKKHFISSPIKTLKRFYEICGIPSCIDYAQSQKMDVDALTKDLNLLYNNFTVPKNVPILIIGASDDIIVPPIILYDNFVKNSNIKIEIISTGKHALGLLNEHVIYKKIINFIK